MELNFERIIRLKKIKIEKSELLEEEEVLSTPILTDKNLIHEIYWIFAEILSEIDFSPNVECVTQRKKFLFIILSLFAPGALADGRMPNGLRKVIESVFPDIRPCTISNNLKDVIFLYQQYKDFRKDIEYLYTEILNRLRFKGLINQ